MRVGVLFGGDSAEREVSLLCGERVLVALKRLGIDTLAIDGRIAFAQWSQEPMDCVFIAIPGAGGEDGCVQGALELAGIPYTGSGVLASALATDKWRSRQLFKQVGLPVPASVMLSAGQVHPDEAQIRERLGVQPEDSLFVKPNRLGSSLGCVPVDGNGSDFATAIAEALRWDSEVLVEERLDGPEYSVGVLADRLLPSIRIEAAKDRAFYDYVAKYEEAGTSYSVPSGLSPVQEQHLAELARKAWDGVGGTGWGRVDMMAHQGDFPILEVNTVPGLTSHSLVPMAAAHSGIDFEELIHEIVRQALMRSGAVQEAQ